MNDQVARIENQSAGLIHPRNIQFRGAGKLPLFERDFEIERHVANAHFLRLREGVRILSIGIDH
jgi:hypothetical protein